uniref:GRF-type domain-containing protein n=1 Tax=Nelumbo nucifera TaxID=4432 RepID=A0A822XJ64_NELNU|nr:TPA_asm: hypothetical protein HUJ06_020489 [Nelumbo nucifera]
MTIPAGGMNSQSTSEIRFYKYLKYNARYCKCGRKCIIRVSDTPANPQRLFYTCPRKMVNDTNEETRNSNMKSCNFFEWAVPINTLDEATSTRTM